MQALIDASDLVVLLLDVKVNDSGEKLHHLLSLLALRSIAIVRLINKSDESVQLEDPDISESLQLEDPDRSDKGDPDSF